MREVSAVLEEYDEQNSNSRYQALFNSCADGISGWII